ncbi:hypothetical protein ASC97_05655 [Rhizobium sp. Root1203]|nr:hypothetical protein ASC97_05655 [Rhizobium sp. Root1203]
MYEGAFVSRRSFIVGGPAAGVALLTGSKASALSTHEPVIGLLQRHKVTLAENSPECLEIEKWISENPPVVQTTEGALQCLRSALRVDNMDGFESALVSSALKFLER